jgi:drug/metabolite transporter (DMT)-like permease
VRGRNAIKKIAGEDTSTTRGSLLIGIAFALGAVASFAIMDIIGKALSDVPPSLADTTPPYPILEVLILRLFVMLLLTSLYIYIRLARSSWKTRFWQFQFWRGVAWTATTTFFAIAFGFKGSSVLGIYIVTFIHPVILLLLTWKWPGLRIFPLLIMFGGVLFSCKTAISTLNFWPTFLALLAGITFATTNFMTENLSVKYDKYNKDNPSTPDLGGNAAYQLLFSCFVSLPFVILLSLVDIAALEHSADSPLLHPWRLPSLLDAIGLIAQGVMAFLGNVWFTRAIQRIGAAMASPYDYLILIFGAIFDWLLFNVSIPWEIGLGAIIVASGGIWFAVLEIIAKKLGRSAPTGEHRAERQRLPP